MAPKARPHIKWLNSYAKVSAWMGRWPPLHQMLKQGEGIVKITGLFPREVAEGILSDLEATHNWNDTSAEHDYSQNNIQHSFLSVRQGIEEAVRALSLLLPGELHSFSAAKYLEGNHIDPHDDRAYTQVLMDDGAVVTCSRTIAVIYYLTKGWQPEYGGLLVDMEAQGGGPKTYVPEFNSAIAFRIPRWHLVTPMAPGAQRARYTLFGWFLKPGRLYDLQLHPSPAMPGAAVAAGAGTGQQQQQHGRGAGKEEASREGAAKSRKRRSATQGQQSVGKSDQSGSQPGNGGTAGEDGNGHSDSDGDPDGGGLGLVRLTRVMVHNSSLGSQGQAGGQLQGSAKRHKLERKS